MGNNKVKITGNFHENKFTRSSVHIFLFPEYAIKIKCTNIKLMTMFRFVFLYYDAVHKPASSIRKTERQDSVESSIGARVSSAVWKRSRSDKQKSGGQF